MNNNFLPGFFFCNTNQSILYQPCRPYWSLIKTIIVQEIHKWQKFSYSKRFWWKCWSVQKNKNTYHLQNIKTTYSMDHSKTSVMIWDNVDSGIHISFFDIRGLLLKKWDSRGFCISTTSRLSHFFNNKPRMSKKLMCMPLSTLSHIITEVLLWSML
jgi:hypothetical protein